MLHQGGEGCVQLIEPTETDSNLQDYTERALLLCAAVCFPGLGFPADDLLHRAGKPATGGAARSGASAVVAVLWVVRMLRMMQGKCGSFLLHDLQTRLRHSALPEQRAAAQGIAQDLLCNLHRLLPPAMNLCVHLRTAAAFSP